MSLARLKLKKKMQLEAMPQSCITKLQLSVYKLIWTTTLDGRWKSDLRSYHMKTRGEN